ncbi:cell division protein FtsQ/DivIB [Cytobacillus sp. Hz8]|uniref:cell division protein FtsQ/DivIB n=1 Tax=Cytobacillus sp. Hz8 TaxID=3347168 RepID=UPI0035DF6B3E
MKQGKVVSIEDRIPKLKQQRRKKANKRLIFLLFLFFFLIVLIVYFQSPLSHVRTISISGNQIYSKQQIEKISGINHHTNIWKINDEKIKKSIRKLPEIKMVKVSVQLPNTLIITLKEEKRVAYMDIDNALYPVLENGKILKQNSAAKLQMNVPILKGFSEGDILNTLIKGLGEMPGEVKNAISEIHYTPKKMDDDHISLYMNDGFEVSASLRNFSSKMAHYPAIVSQLDPNKKGVIDLEVGSYFKSFE